MSKHDLQARPIYHRKRDSIEAHLTIVFAALASQPLDREPDRLVNPQIRQTTRRYRTIEIQAGTPPSPPPNPCPTTCAMPSTKSTAPRCALNEPSRVAAS